MTRPLSWAQYQVWMTWFGARVRGEVSTLEPIPYELLDAAADYAAGCFDDRKLRQWFVNGGRGLGPPVVTSRYQQTYREAWERGQAWRNDETD